LESRGFSVKQIANILGVPPHLLGEGAAGEKSLESENQSFLDHSLDPWLDAFEDECERKLLTETEQRSYKVCVEFDRSRLLKTDLLSRYEAYAIGRQWGWISVNDIRKEEGDESIDGGDVYLQPGNMTAVNESPADTETHADDGTDPEDDPSQVAKPMVNPADVNNTGLNRSALASAIAGAASRLVGVREKRLAREKDTEKVQLEIRSQVSEIVAPLLAVRFDSGVEDKVGEFLAIWDSPDCEAKVQELLK
jgi:hypothetical protein